MIEQEQDKKEKVIKFDPAPFTTKRKINSKSENSGTSGNDNIISKKLSKKCIIVIIVIIALIMIAIGVGVSLFILLNGNKELPPDPPIEEKIEIGISKEINSNVPEYMKENGPLEMQTEYEIQTNVKDLKRIYINQKYYEDIKIDGILSKNIVDRKTNYDIFVMDKIQAINEEKYFYNFTYLCAIAISSECVSSTDEYCVPKKLVDLNDQDKSNLRNLQEIDNLENFPIPLCFFNLTDNNVITSISCHKKLSESKINSIVLDLYFFRPPGIKRIDQKETNVTINKEKIGNNEKIRETNGGICDIDNPIGSFCTTDMNTTKDSKGNLIAYDEVAFTKITKDEDNYYIKTKITNLMDKTNNNISELNPEKYNETLNKLYPHLKDYLKNFEQFSLENFKELYNVSKGLLNEVQAKRRLKQTGQVIEKKKNLFHFSHYGGVEIKISLKDNIGYNAEAMEASNLLEIGDNKTDLAIFNHYTDMDKIIKKLKQLSKAGNNLATALYNKVKENLNNITEIININIPSISSLLVYKELSDIFDSTYSLKSLKIIPNGIIEESNYLVSKIEDIYKGIENGNLKNHIVVLNNYIYQYIKQSHILVDKISSNLRELGKLIKSPKQTISDISYYYMNHTSSSYINTITQARDILMNYYQNEKDLIVPKVDKILEQFENVTVESLEKQINLIRNLSERLESKDLAINNTNEEDFKKIIVNLHNSNDYIGKIINLFKKKVENEMDLKDGYFISTYDINSKNETFSRTIEEALEIAQKLDDNEYIDKLFDEIMLNFRQSFIDITKDMEKQREENFIINENSLKSSYFKISEQQNISQELKELGKEIIVKIKEENNLYLDKVDKVINEFLENNKDYLEQLIREINILFSIDSLEKIKNSYESAFNRTFDRLKDEIEQNKNLTKEYFDGMAGLMTNNNKIIELLKTYVEEKKYSEYSLMCKTNDTINEIHCYNNTFFNDSINSRKYGKDYLNKFERFKEKLDISKEFIKSDLHSSILNEYKNVIIKLKEVLQSFKNNKISDKYPDYTKLDFIDDHINNIDEFYNRLNRYISNDIFNNDYIPKIDDYKLKEIEEIENISLYIEEKNVKIKVGQVGRDKDFCSTFTRKRTFTCRNGAIPIEYSPEDVCIDSWGSDNLNKMIELSFKNDKTFEQDFNIFYSSLKNKIDSYNNLINRLKENITSIEAKILEKNITHNYLYLIQDKIDLILNEKYSDNLIKGSYDYYKNILDKRLENLLNDISNNWNNSFENLRKNVEKNLGNFKSSMNEFGIMALIYEAIISQNLTKTFYESIINHQKSEFNYTISYYYNILLRNITSVYQYVFNQIPTNQEGFNNITNLRRREVQNKFNQLLEKVKKSKSDSLSINYQIYVLQVSSSNFFNTNSIFSTNINGASSNLKNKGNIIYKLKNGKKIDEMSLATRFYLENSLNGLQIEEYYQPINDDDSLFISLNLNKFMEILSDNWIFDQDDFINQLNISIFNSNLDIKNDFSTEKEEYFKKLEKEITKYGYSKENISQKISEQYKTNIKEIDGEKKNRIINYINEILNLIKNHLIKEEERLIKNAISYTSNFSAINKTIQNYKETLFNKIEKIILKIVDDFHENLEKEAYVKIIEPGLNIYLEKAENHCSNNKTYETLNSSYNMGEIIYEKVKGLVEEYKNITKMQLKDSHDRYIKKLNEELGMDEIKKLINDNLNLEYSKLLNILKNITKDFKSGTIGYDDYDLSDIIKNDVNKKIQENYEKINNTLIEIKADKNNKIKLIGWDNLVLCYDNLETETFNEIEKDFEFFITKKINSEKMNINKILKKIIRNNFNSILNNLISTFGMEFFERIIKYNENFKITSLYQNLKYSLVISLNYYKMLYNLKRNINALSNDLKIKLYNLNNLDKIAEKENKIVLNNINVKIDDFIEQTKQHILNDYKSYLTSDTSIKLSFNERILKSLVNNLKEVSSDLENDYLSLLNEQFKKKFIDSYKKIMNEQTSDMIQTINYLKEDIESLFDDLFSLDIEKVLNQSNYQMNVTLDSIEEYKNHFDSFKIPEKLIEYSLNYGNNIIKPSFEKLELLINKETKSLTLNNLEIKSKDFEKYFKVDELVQKLDKIISSIEDNNNNIMNGINLYGNTEYPNVLENEINRIDQRALRRLNGEQNEEDLIEEYKEKIADKSLDDCFHKLLNISKNTKNFIKTYEYFDKFVENIDKNKKKLNLSYKVSQQTINDAYLGEDDDIYQELNDKLETLNNLSLNYYNEIKDKFILLRNYTEKSLNEIDKLLNECANITYETFATKYDNISKEANSFDIPHDETDEDYPSITRISSSQNNEYITDAEFKALIKKARFKFSLEFEEEGNIKKPRIVAFVNNEIKPKSVKFKISNKFGECGEQYQTVDVVEFNKVNYTIALNYGTNNNLLNISTITDFEPFDYIVARYRINETEGSACSDSLGISLCINDCADYDAEIVDEPKLQRNNKQFEIEQKEID